MPDLSVVITGSTRGLGLALADVFLSKGATVTISGRSEASVDAAKKQLAAKHPGERIRGRACDVSDYAQVEALYATGGKVDLFINNAGAATRQIPLAQVEPGELRSCVDCNFTGTVNGSHVALKAMLKSGGGTIVNLEGYGSTGQVRLGMAAYASTKAAVRSFTKTMVLECKGTNVRVCSLMPGPVATDMLWQVQSSLPPEQFAKVRRLYSTLGDTPEVIAAWAAERLLAGPVNGANINRISPGLFLRFLRPSYRKRDLFAPFEKRAGN